jgi:predicted protein tyrosine phosphatase
MTEVPEVDIVVASYVEAGDMLAADPGCEGIPFIVSIGDPDDLPPAGWGNVRDKLRLVFYDTNDGEGPTEEDVQKIIDFAAVIRRNPGRVLAHCQAGISRSSATAFILYSILMGRGREGDALQRVMTQRPIAMPNRRMIAMADRLLQRDGAMVRALAALPRRTFFDEE